ncbi:hypothetical protein ACIHDR_11285 [Nocardia sp. NPDC052278]|uniref:hypothetical protein n=1 Tax=unclassified Nocardia TaxID=2637762 RepID=UPI0036A05D5A
MGRAIRFDRFDAVLDLFVSMSYATTTVDAIASAAAATRQFRGVVAMAELGHVSRN